MDLMVSFAGVSTLTLSDIRREGLKSVTVFSCIFNTCAFLVSHVELGSAYVKKG